MMPKHSLQILATRWSYLHWLQIWPPGGATCISLKLVKWHNFYWFKTWPPGCLTALPHYCLELPYWHYQLVLSWYQHQPESHQLSFQKGVSLTQWVTSAPIDRTPGVPGSDKNVHRYTSAISVTSLLSTQQGVCGFWKAGEIQSSRMTLAVLRITSARWSVKHFGAAEVRSYSHR